MSSSHQHYQQPQLDSTRIETPEYYVRTHSRQTERYHTHHHVPQPLQQQQRYHQGKTNQRQHIKHQHKGQIENVKNQKQYQRSSHQQNHHEQHQHTVQQKHQKKIRDQTQSQHCFQHQNQRTQEHKEEHHSQQQHQNQIHRRHQPQHQNQSKLNQSQHDRKQHRQQHRDQHQNQHLDEQQQKRQIHCREQQKHHHHQRLTQRHPQNQNNNKHEHQNHPEQHPEQPYQRKQKDQNLMNSKQQKQKRSRPLTNPDKKCYQTTKNPVENNRKENDQNSPTNQGSLFPSSTSASNSTKYSMQKPANYSTSEVTASSRSKRQRVKTNDTTTTTTSQSTSTRPRGYPKPLGRGNGFPFLSRGRYLKAQSEKFYIKSDFSKKCRSYDILNSVGDILFQIDPTPLCLSETKSMIDVNRKGNEVLNSHQMVFTTRSSVFINDSHGHSLLFLQKLNMVNFPKIIQGFIKTKTATRPNLIVSKDEEGDAYIFRDRRSNEVACLEKYIISRSKRSDDPSKKRKLNFGHKLYVSAGYDCALFIMCAVLSLDMWNE